MNEFILKLKKEKTEGVLRRGESFNEMYIYCPYCAHEHSDDIWEDFDLTPNGDEQEGECRECEKPFFYSVSLAYSTRKGK